MKKQFNIDSHFFRFFNVLGLLFFFFSVLPGCIGSVKGRVESLVSPQLAFKILNKEKYVAVGSSFKLNIEGGSSPFTFSLLTGAGKIDESGSYTAPLSVGPEVIFVKDSSGNYGYYTINIVSKPIMQPKSYRLAKGKSKILNFVGGVGPYTFSILDGAGEIDAATGRFKASSTTTGVVTVKLTDGIGSSDTAQINVQALAEVAATNTVVNTGGTVTLSGSGEGAPFKFEIVAGGGLLSNPTEQSVDFTAGGVNGTTVVRVTDNFGNSQTIVLATVNSSLPVDLSIASSSPQVSQGGEVYLSQIGGSGAGSTYQYYVLSGPGTVQGSVYLAPQNETGTVTIQGSDGNGHTATLQIEIVNKPTLVIPQQNIYAGDTIGLTSTGGVGAISWFVDRGSIHSSSGSFKAPNSGGVVNITLIDSVGSKQGFALNIYEHLQIAPENFVIPRNSAITFSAIGGKPPYNFTPSSDLGTIETENMFISGSELGSLEVVVEDSLGEKRTAKITIQDKLSLNPFYKVTTVGKDVILGASGGAGGYSFELVSDTSGGSLISIDEKSAKFVAGSQIGSASIRLKDQDNNLVESEIKINGALAVSSSFTKLAFGNKANLVVEGGIPPFQFSVGSGATALSLIQTTGTQAEVQSIENQSGTGSIEVKDSAGDIVTLNFQLYPEILVDPLIKYVKVGDSVFFLVSGGVGNYKFSILEMSQLTEVSGGSFNFTQTQAPGTYHIIVKDENQNYSIGTVVVGPILQIMPALKTLALNNTFGFSASGGAGVYSFSKVSGDGAIGSGNGQFVAGGTVGTTVLRVTDQAGQTSDATVTINPSLSISPLNLTTAVNKTTTFSATGGVGGNTFSVLLGGKGSIDPSTGVFSAGLLTGSSTVLVADSYGNSANATVTIVPALGISPVSPSVEAGGSLNFSGIEGVPPYSFTVTGGAGNGSITAGGLYTAPTISGQKEVVVTDAQGSTQSTNVNVLPDVPVKLAVTGANSSTSTQCSSAINIVVRDQYNNPSPPSSDITVNLGGNGTGSFYSDSSCSQSISAATIVASTSQKAIYFKANTAQVYNLTVVDAAANLTGTGLGFTVNVGPATKIAFAVQPGSAQPGEILNPAIEVQIQDAGGNKVTAASDSIALSISVNPGSAVLQGSTTKPTISGSVLFDDIKFSLGGIGYRLKAVSTNFGEVQSNLIDIVSFGVMQAAPDIVPHDNMAESTIYFYPTYPDTGLPIGTGKTVEVVSSLSTVTFVGGAACRSPSSTCSKMTDSGGGTYSVRIKGSTIGVTNLSFVIGGSPDINVAKTLNVNFDTNAYTTISTSTSVTSANSWASSGKHLYLIGAVTVTFDNSTVGQSFGHILIRGATVQHVATSSSAMYKLDIQAKSLTLQSGSLNANTKGYLSGYSFGSAGPSTTLASAGSSGGACFPGYMAGASHGGKGGASGGNSSGVTYGDYRDPSYPGAGKNGIGGGVIKINSEGPCTIFSGAGVYANGGTGAAGGSINLRCSFFGGDAAANSLTANGGNGLINTPDCWTNYTGGGGGGRIALVSTLGKFAFTGSFNFPVDTSSLANFNSVIKAIGGTEASATVNEGGAGTIYIKHSSLQHGALIVNNGRASATIRSNSGTTFLPSLAGSISGSPSGTNLPVNVSSTPALSAGFVNLYTGLKIRPRLAFNNGTSSDWTDDNVLTVASNSTTAMTTVETIANVANLDTFRSLDIFDHLEVGGGAKLDTNGDIYVVSGNLENPTTTLWQSQNALIEQNGGASFNLPTRFNLASGVFSMGSLVANNISVTGGTTTLTSATVQGDLTLSGGSFVTTALSIGQDLSISGGTVTADSLNVNRDLNLSTGGKLNHNATDTTSVRKLMATIGRNLNIDNNGSIDVTGLGYTNGYSFGASAPSPALASPGGDGGACFVGYMSGASHGGKGASINSQGSGPTYGNYRHPITPGAGKKYSGGGVAHLTVTGSCTLNGSATIKANGLTSGAAGGSIYLQCASIGGNASANSIVANGADAGAVQMQTCGYPAGYTIIAGGGGGRVALVSTGPASSFSGSFKFPTSQTELNAFISTVKANGGAHAAASPTRPGGGAGTVFIKHSESTDGSLIISNGQSSPTVYPESGTTFMPSMSGSVNGAPGTNSLPVSVTSTPALAAAYVDLYAGIKLRPNLAYNSGTTTDWSDDGIVTVSSNSSTALTTSENLTNVSNGDMFRSIDIVDHLYVGDGAILETNGDIYSRFGVFTNTNTFRLNLPNAFYRFNGGSSNLVLDSELSGGSYDLATSIYTTDFIVSNSLTLNVPSINATGTYLQSAGTVTTQSISVGGNMTLSGTAQINHLPSSTTVTNKLSVNVTGSFSLSNSAQINVTDKGYPADYSYGPSAPSTATASSGSYGVPCASGSASGASHGGRGGQSNGVATGVVYGDYKNPLFPGGGRTGGYGGGAIRVQAGGICTINSGSKITADATTTGAAGGSINLRCSGFAGDAGVSALSANGGAASNALLGGCYWRSVGGGSGGRIALVSSGNESSFAGSFLYPKSASQLANFKSVVKALGGNPTSSTVTGGAAGTIYLKHSDISYGDLIIDNGSQTTYATTGTTELMSLSVNSNTVYSTPNSTTAQLASSGTPLANWVDLFMGHQMQVYPISGASEDPLNAAHIENTISSNTTLSIVMSAASLPAISNDYYYRIVHRLNRLDVGGNAQVTMPAASLILEPPASSSCDLHSATEAMLEVPSGSLLSGFSIGSTICKDSYLTSKGTTINFGTNYFLIP